MEIPFPTLEVKSAYKVPQSDLKKILRHVIWIYQKIHKDDYLRLLPDQSHIISTANGAHIITPHRDPIPYPIPLYSRAEKDIESKMKCSCKIKDIKLGLYE